MFQRWRDARVYAQVATPGLRLRRVRMYVDNGHAETKPGEASHLGHE